ncbi:hypothetical protein PPYR_07909 [Photinus pyralis]|uniref:Tubulin delta chain n=1 Tax=Photinus pyralis TaxID=7054 RepID=A0A1Y1NI40_PHOPY|nr:tubulin delta chain-like [Photinus pyralis]XP_031347754.1 tubulin delta chain-like [Photinus pyralis]KAB0800029.1 hypothetical protein PPYR_07909 [Photinus pyralis]
MSILTLQFGQCGNQIGKALYEELYSDIKTDVSKTGVGKKANVEYVTESVKKWFTVNKSGALEVRSILIDTESKVVANVTANGHYKFRNVVAKSHGGAANNWAYGYTTKSELLTKDIQDGVRKEIERDGTVLGIMGILGSAGGTGSGVGSRTLEILRDEYPKKLITGVVVLPYKRGEVVTQSYNSLLTLAKLCNVTDGIYLYENDTMHKMCSKLLSVANVTFLNINSLIAQQLAATFQPLQNTSVWDIHKSLTPHPIFKLIQVKSAPHVSKEYLKFEAPTTWSVLINQIRNSIKPDLQDYLGKFNRRMQCTGNALIGRGSTPFTADDLSQIADSALYVGWVPSQYCLSNFYHIRSFKDNKKFVTFLTNNNYACLSLKGVLDDAWTLFGSRAYLHHYQRFNIDEQFFLDSFDAFETLYESYKGL